MTFTHCLKPMTGALMIVRIQGTVLSILFARAISIAAAEKGEGKRREGSAGRGIVGVVLSGVLGRSAGVISGELKQRR